MSMDHEVLGGLYHLLKFITPFLPPKLLMTYLCVKGISPFKSLQLNCCIDVAHVSCTINQQYFAVF